MRKRHEFFRITQYSRIYDKRRQKFTINISYETAVPASSRSVAVAEAFGLGLDQEERFVIYDNVDLKIGPKDTVLITGDSGSGKSVLLRALLKDLGHEALDMAKISTYPSRPLIEAVGETVEEGLELLSKVGLNDAFLFLRTYNQLSDGQRYRYRVAKLVESGRQWWFMDEFCATLDRDTAKIVAYNVQKLARALGKAVVVATTHMDLFDDLRPSVHVHKRFGKEFSVRYYKNEPANECSLVKEMCIEQGSTKEWRELAGFHYRSHRTPAPRKIFCLKRGEELCGVIVYSYPAPACFGRRLVLPRMSMRELNEKLSAITRVVLHPKYRTIGLGARLVRETLGLAGTPFIEMPAVMAKYNPFAEKAGMKKIIEQPPATEAIRIIERLEELGFNKEEIASSRYVLGNLEAMGDEDVAKVRDAFIKHRHPRFLKNFSYDLPFGTKEAYEKKVMDANLPVLAHLIKICGFLLQTKVYLFWRRP